MLASTLIGVFLEAFVAVLAGALRVAILVRVAQSWVAFSLPFGLDGFVREVSEPILGRLRRALPYLGGMDFSPFVALVALQAVETLVHGLLRQL